MLALHSISNETLLLQYSQIFRPRFGNRTWRQEMGKTKNADESHFSQRVILFFLSLLIL